MSRFLCRKLSLSALYLILLLPLCTFFLYNPPPAQAAGPQSCRVGAYLTDLYDLNTGNKSFSADLWLWSNCANKVFQPLQSVEYMNANTISTSLYSLTREGKLYWSSIKVSGTFRYNWDVQNYPFDRHTLEVVLEEGEADSSTLNYTPDTANSSYNQNIALEGWHITDFKIVGSQDAYMTDFGDPTMRAGSGSKYTQIRVQITIARSDYTNVFQLMAPVYFSFAITLISFFLMDTSLSLGLLAGVLFVVVINLRDVTNALGSDSGMTAVDFVHVVTLLYIFTAVIISIMSQQMTAHGYSTKAIVRLNRYCFWASLLSFTLINIILVILAINNG